MFAGIYSEIMWNFVRKVFDFGAKSIRGRITQQDVEEEENPWPQWKLTKAGAQLHACSTQCDSHRCISLLSDFYTPNLDQFRFSFKFIVYLKRVMFTRNCAQIPVLTNCWSRQSFALLSKESIVIRLLLFKLVEPYQ